MDGYANHVIAVLLMSLRIGPSLAFAPPFTYLRIPATIRVFLGFGLAAWIVFASPSQLPAELAAGWLVQAIATELLLGLVLTLSLQIAFSAVLMAGRAIDFQAGFSFAVLADPSLRSQMPLVGSLLAYAAAAIFFATTGPLDLLALWAKTAEWIPIGQYGGPSNLAPLLTFVSAVFVTAVGLVGAVLLALFLVDLTIALLSRTLPQMNVLMLGFQVKTLTTLITLPLVFSLSSALFLRIVRLAIDNTLSFI